MGLFTKTPEQQAEAAWRIRAKAEPHKCRMEAIRQGDVLHFDYLSQMKKCSNEQRREVIREIATNNAFAMLSIFVKKNGISCFNDNSHGGDAWHVMNALALSSKHETEAFHAFLLVTARTDKNISQYITLHGLAEAYARNGARDKLEETVKRMGSEGLKAHIGGLLSAATESKSEDVFNYIAGFAKNYDVGSYCLERLLGKTVHDGQADRSATLISLGAKIKNEMGILAGKNADKKTLQILKDRGFTYRGSAFRAEWDVELKLGTITPETDNFMWQLSQDKTIEKAAAPMEKKEIPQEKTIAPVKVVPVIPVIAADMDIRSDTVTLPNGLSMTTVFNFASQQQIVVVEKLNPPMMTTTVIHFADLPDHAALQAAEQKLIAENRRSDLHRGVSFKQWKK